MFTPTGKAIDRIHIPEKEYTYTFILGESMIKVMSKFNCRVKRTKVASLQTLRKT